MLVYTIITYLNNVRFGIPESLSVILAKTKNKRLTTNLIVKSFLILIVIVIVTLVVMFLIESLIGDWRVILGDVYEFDKDIVLNLFYILVLFALLKIPLDISLNIFVGYHEVYIEKKNLMMKNTHLLR